MRLRFMLLFLLFLPGLVACQPLSTDRKDEVRTLRIAWIPKALDNPVFELGRKGFPAGGRTFCNRECEG